MIDKIKDYNSYKGVPIFRDFNVVDGEQVYIGDGQGCGTFWFSSVPEAKKFINRYQNLIKVIGIGLIPKPICQSCKGHYSYDTPQWKQATRDNCEDFKEALKKEVSNAKPI